MSDIIFLDWETHWTTEYSLTHMPTDEYILDSKFQAMSLAVAEGPKSVPYIVDPTDVGAWIRDSKYEERAVAAHNAKFDLGIGAYRYAAKPKLCIDTLAMSRWGLGRTVKSHSLGKLGEALGLGGKRAGGAALLNTRGLRLEDLTTAQLKSLQEYNVDDVELLRAIYYVLYPMQSPVSMDLIDWTTQMFLTPLLKLDVDDLRTQHQHEIAYRTKLWQRLGLDGPKALNSPAKFKSILESHGVDIAMKESPRTPGKMIPQFAKTDPFMQDLMEHPSDVVRTVASAKLELGSSIKPTRLQRFVELGERHVGNIVPVFLNFGGAQNTCRMSGGDKLNWQNPQNPPASMIRRAIIAPPGQKLVVCDSSQIELRIAAELAAEKSIAEAFHAGKDPYILMAAKLFAVTYDVVTKEQRRYGKIVMLALGYGMGISKFVKTLRLQGADSSFASASQMFQTYRGVMTATKRAWKLGDVILSALTRLLQDENPDPKYKIPVYNDTCGRRLLELSLTHYPVDGGVWVPTITLLPTGFKIKYPGLRKTLGGYEYQGSMGMTNIYGAKVWENIIQALASAVMQYHTRIIRRMYPTGLQVHDELVCVVDEAEADEAQRRISKVMSTPPVWWPELPVSAEASVVDSYIDAK